MSVIVINLYKEIIYTMQNPSLKLPRSLWLAPALGILLLGAATSRLTAQTITDNFNTDGGISPGTNLPPNWAPYLLPNSYYDPAQQQNVISYGGLYATIGEDTYYGQGTYYYPTNPASAANYAFRITCPTITNDNLGLQYSRAGAFRPDANYTGRFFAAVDMVNWNNTWNDQALGLAFYANVDDPLNPSTYAIGWGPGLSAIGIIVLQVAGSYPDFALTYGIIGAATGEGGAVLNTNHQYRFTASSHNGTDFMVQCFDTLQPNSPWQSAISTDTTLTGGYTGLLVANTQETGPDMTQGGDATFDNFYSTVPATGAMPATVTDLSPPPAGRATSQRLEVGIYNRDTSVNTGTIGLYMDGQPVTSGVNISNYVYKPHNNDQLGTLPGPYPTNFPGATVYYTIPNVYALGSLHTNMVVFRDSANTWFTNIWSWTVGWPIPLPSGSLSVRGFDARLVESFTTNADQAVYTNYANIGCQDIDYAHYAALQNSVAAAQAVLATPYKYTVNFAATNIVQLINFCRDSGTDAHNGNAYVNFPGMCIPAPSPMYVNSYAVEVLAYLDLPAGTNHFWVDSDDAVAVYTGSYLTDTSVVLMSNNGVAHQQFDWTVLNAGLYPVHIVFEEGVGGSYLGLSTLNLTANTTNLVNNTGSVQAYYPLVCLSSTSVKGPFTPDAAANAANVLQTVGTPAPCESGPGPNNLTVTGGTITVPIPTAPKYYRLDGPRKTKITSITKSGTNLIINYQAY
jgi:hypothetical protein